MKSQKFSNISNIVSIHINPERIDEEYIFKEVTNYSWKYPFRSKVKMWVSNYRWGYDCFYNVEDLIEYEKGSKELRYDEKEGKLFVKPYLYISYVDRTSDKLVFESDEEMNKFYQNKILSRKGFNLLKIY